MFSSKKYTALLSDKYSWKKNILQVGVGWNAILKKKLIVGQLEMNKSQKRVFPPKGTFWKRTFILEDFESIIMSKAWNIRVTLESIPSFLSAPWFIPGSYYEKKEHVKQWQVLKLFMSKVTIICSNKSTSKTRLVTRNGIFVRMFLKIFDHFIHPLNKTNKSINPLKRLFHILLVFPQ